MAKAAKNRKGNSLKAEPAAADVPAKVSTATVVEPEERPPEELPPVPPALERWLQRHGPVLAISIFLVAATAAVYAQTLGFEFVSYDDGPYIYENGHVKQGFTWDTLRWAFTGVNAGNWYPLTTLTHVLDWTLYEKWAGGHHLTNVLLHAASSIVLFLALRRLTGATWRSGLVAALFCLHPAHVESVAWVSERKDMLSGLFFGLTLWAYAAYAEAAGSSEQGAGSKTGVAFPWGKYTLVLALFALGLLSKPMLVTVPFLLLLLDYWPLDRLTSRSLALRALIEKLPLVALSAADCVVTYLVQRSADAVNENIAMADRVQLIALGYVRYLAMLVWPFGLAYRYPRDTFSVPKTAICAAALLAVSVLVLLTCRHRRRYVFVGWFWFLAMIVPVSGIVIVGEGQMHDRYTYLSYTGLFVAIVWGAAELLQRRAGSRTAAQVPRRGAGSEEQGAESSGLSEDAPVAHPVPAPLPTMLRTVPEEGRTAVRWAWALAGGVLALFALRSLQQAQTWRDSEALFEQCLAMTPDDWAAHSTYGRVLEMRGSLVEAEEHYRKSLALEARDYQAHTGLGFIERQRGNMAAAIEHYRAALEIKPDFAPAHSHLGVAYASTGRMAEAEQEWLLAIKCDPNFAEAEFNLGKSLVERKKDSEAVPHLRRAVELDARNAAYRRLLGATLFHAGSFEEGIEECKRAIELQGDDVAPRLELALMYFRLGRLGEAADEWRKVVKLQPANAAAAKGIGIVLLKTGRGAEAMAPLSYALSVMPQDVELRESLSLACIATKDVRVALIGFRKILDVDPKNQNAINSLAWIEATAGDAKLRNAKEAVELAEKAAAGPSRFQPNVLDTLAAAYAEAGRFGEAAATAHKAKEAAEKGGNQALAAEIDARIKLYESHKPYRDPMLAKP